MFRYLHLDRRQVKHLPFHNALNPVWRYVMATVRTYRVAMRHHLIGLGYHFQRIPFMPRLTTGFTFAFFTTAFRVGLLQPIATRRLATVATIFV
jgi:hypothetical protein